MKRILLVGLLALSLSAGVLAQQPAPKTPPSQPVALTEGQKQQLEQMRLALVQAQTEAALAQERVEKIQAQIGSVIKDFFLDLGVDPHTYERKLELIDPQQGKIGFLPKPQLPAPDDANTKPKKAN